MSDRMKLKLPLFGGVQLKSAISRFSRTLGTLVTSGVPILQALNITKETAGNLIIANSISKVHDAVKEGESMVAPLESSNVFPPMVISMVDVGEETGQLPEMLLKIADVYALVGKPENFSFYIHGRGHSVPHESRELICAFLDVHLKPAESTSTHLLPR